MNPMPNPLSVNNGRPAGLHQADQIKSLYKAGLLTKQEHDRAFARLNFQLAERLADIRIVGEKE